MKKAADDAKAKAATCDTALSASTQKAQQLEKQINEFSKNLNATKDELEKLRAQKAEADKRMAAIEDIQKQFAKMIDTGQLKISARRGELVISLPSEVLFPSGSAELSKTGEYAVVEVARRAQEVPGAPLPRRRPHRQPGLREDQGRRARGRRPARPPTTGSSRPSARSPSRACSSPRAWIRRT